MAKSNKGKKSKSTSTAGAVSKAVKCAMRPLFSLVIAPLADSLGKVIPSTSKFKIIGDRMVKLNHAGVNQLAQYEAIVVNGVKIDRPLNLLAAVELALDMLNGKFLYERVIFATAVFNGKEYRINGQTTLAARLMLDDPNTAPKIRWIRYEVYSEDDLRELYAVIDKCRARTCKDVLKALLYGTLGYRNVTMTQIGLLGSGLNHWLNHRRSGKVNAERRAFMLTTQYFRTAKKVIDVLGSTEYDHSWRTAVVAALLTVFSEPRYITDGRVFRFWRTVVTGVGIQSERSAEARLFKYLSEHGIGYETNKNKLVKTETMYRVCILYFKSWLIDGPLDCIEDADGKSERPTL